MTNPLIQEAIDKFPEAENTYEVLVLFEAEIFRSLSEFSKELKAALIEQSQKLEELTTKYLTVKELRKTAPVLSVKEGIKS